MGGVDSKLYFREKVFNLLDDNAFPDSDFEGSDSHLNEKAKEYFNDFFQLPQTAQDIFSFITTQDLKSLRDKFPHRFKLFFKMICHELFQQMDSSERNKTRLANCIRYLTRLLPFIFEKDLDRDLLWNTLNENHQDKEASESLLAERLLNATIHLLFFPGFTLPIEYANHENLKYAIWVKGIGCSSEPASSPEQDQYRTEVLKLFLVFLSREMYHPSGSKEINSYAQFIVTQSDKTTVLAVLCSLLNTVIQYRPDSGWIPYNHVIWEDQHELLVQTSAEVLVALLDYTNELLPFPTTQEQQQPQQQHQQEEENQEVKEKRNSIDQVLYQRRNSKTERENTNLFRYYLSRLHRKEDFELILNGLHLLISNPIQVNSSLLPNYYKKVGLIEEIYLLFWKIIEVNPKFLEFAVKDEKILEIMAGIIYETLSAKQTIARIGMIRMSCFLLHTLSGERDFAVLLNKPFNLTPPAHLEIPKFTKGCYADFLFLSLYALMFTTKSRFVSLYDCLLTILSNISPFIKSFNVVTANKLLSMFSYFANPVYLFKSESSHALIFYVLDFMNNVIQYQFDGNPNLIYEILRREKEFLALKGLTYQTGLEQLEKFKEKKKQKSPAPSRESSQESLKVEEVLNDNDFQPTEEWFSSWFQHLPLTSVLSLLESLGPQIEKKITENHWNDEAILNFLQSGTLVGLLPVPHPLFVRKFQYNEQMRIWMTSYIWGVIYLRHTHPLPTIWVGTQVRLFTVKTIDE